MKLLKNSEFAKMQFLIEGVQLGPGAEGQGLRPGLEGQRGNSDLHAHGPWNLVIVRNRVGGLGIRMGMRL